MSRRPHRSVIRRWRTGGAAAGVVAKAERAAGRMAYPAKSEALESRESQQQGLSLPWIGVIMAAFSAVVAGALWVVDAKTGALEKDINGKLVANTIEFRAFRDNVMSLNTPLSQRVFAVEARAGEIARIQSEVRAQIAAVDANGSNQARINERDINTMRSEISGQETGCKDVTRRVDELQRDTLENKMRIQNVIEAISPHELKLRK